MFLSLPRTQLHIHLAIIQLLHTSSGALKDFSPGYLHSSLASLLPLCLGSAKPLVPESFILPLTLSSLILPAPLPSCTSLSQFPFP